MALTQQRKRELLEAIAARKGGLLLAEDVLATAADPEHELHGEFEWDDAKAAHAHRMEQARQLVRTVRVETRVEKTTLSTVYYVKHPEHAAGYIGVPELRTQDELARKAIADEFGRALAALRRARDLATALGFETQIDAELEHIGKLAEALPLLRDVG